MKITLAQSVPLTAAIVKRINDLIRERNEVAFVKAAKGDTYEKPVRTFTQITQELSDMRADLLFIDALKRKANVENSILWNSKDITIADAIELAKQIRIEAAEFKSYGSHKKQDYEQTWGSNANNGIIKYAQFDPEKARLRGIKLESVVRKLSDDIESKNQTVSFDFPAADKYISFDTNLESYTE